MDGVVIYDEVSRVPYDLLREFVTDRYAEIPVVAAQPIAEPPRLATKTVPARKPPPFWQQANWRHLRRRGWKHARSAGNAR